MQKMQNLAEMTAAELDELAGQAARLAADLRGRQPTYALALAGGIQDIGWIHPSLGWIHSYWGKCEIMMDDGGLWRAEGHRPNGGPTSSWISREGYIEFTEID